MDIPAIFAGLAAAASTVDGLGCHAFAPDSIAEPAFFPAEVDIAYNRTMRDGSHGTVITCRLLVSRADDLSGYAAVGGYLSSSGATSVRAAIEADPTLGGTVDWVVVLTGRMPGLIEHAGTAYIGAELMVEVDADG